MKKVISILIVTVTLITLLCPFECAVHGIDTVSDTVLDEYAGCKIGVLTGSIFDQMAKEYIKDPDIQYFNNNADVSVALEKGKIDAYVTDKPIWRIMSQKYPDHECICELTNDSCGFIFSKNNDKATALCNQLNEFLAEYKENGTLKEIDDLWFGTDEDAKTVDVSGLSGENGTLHLSVSTDIGIPFAYVKDNNIVGYDVDIAVRFCRKYGYGIEVVNNSFAGMLADVSIGKADFGASCITITEERKKSMLFSDADYSGGGVLVAKRSAKKSGAIMSIEQLSGTKVAVQSGTVMDLVASEFLPDCSVEYYNSAPDLSVALDSGKVSSYIMDEPSAQMMMIQYPSQRILKKLREEKYAISMPKSNSGTPKLCGEFNDFLKKCREDGSLNEMYSSWINDDRSKQIIGVDTLTGENGTLTMAICSAVGAPFIYVRDNEYVGFDISIAVKFCRAYGYKLKIDDYDAGGLFSSIATGKCDFAASCIAITEERKETIVFSDSYYTGGCVLVVKDGTNAAGSADSDENGGFFASIADSFNRTFIREDRYKLFLSGLFTTVIIVVLSVIFGSALGFLLFFGYYKRGKVFRYIADVLNGITENTPVVVILMILYYVIFGSAEINGMWVSIIGFTLIFGGSVMGLVKVGVDAVDIGQREASLALGYTENRTLFRIILPQAARIFLPGYKSAVIQLIKGTAVVGYIAVQDITKVSDIVRSRTYEAFFPLIAGAILYFAMAMLITAVIKRVEINIDPHSRKKESILKGVDTK